MRHINTPLTLSNIKFAPYTAESDVAKSYPAAQSFDNRHDFLMEVSQSALAVLMTFTNERCLLSDTPSGIRRPVSVTLIDMTDSYVMETTTIRVNITKHDIIGIYRVDFPFAYANIVPDHTYKVSVRDESSKKFLGESTFHMFDEMLCGKHPDKWFVAELGGIISDYSHDFYKSLDAQELTYQKIQYQLTPAFRQTPFIMPELEVKIYFPDGSVSTRFCPPVCDDFDIREYHVEMPFLVHPSSKGICYTEISCMGYAFAGFVFSTQGATVTGSCQEEYLKCLDEYSLSAASERFCKSLGLHEDIPAEEKDEFETALQNFISPEPEKNNEDEEYDDEKYDDEEYDDEFIDTETECDTPAPAFVQQTPELPPLSLLNHLTGLKSVKEKLSVYEKVVRFNKMRLDNGLPVLTTPLHAMFLGAPGTGKTTVARLMGLMLVRAGILSKGHVVIKERATLLGPNYSMEETNTLQAIEEAQGGILLIDEAYQLYQPNDPRDPGKFVIETLMTALADTSKRDWMLILAGYPDEMKRMFEMNPGFKSRIPDTNIYVFDDFTEPELMEIAERYLERHQYSLSLEAREALSKRLSADYSQRNKCFGNARHVVNLIQTDILPAMAVRIISSDDPEHQSLSEILPCDIPLPTETIGQTRPRIGFCA